MKGSSSAADNSMRWSVGVTFCDSWAVSDWVKPCSWRMLPGQRYCSSRRMASGFREILHMPFTSEKSDVNLRNSR